MRRGQIFPTYLKSLTPICLFTYNFYGAAMTFKGRLLLAPLMLKLFFGRKLFLSTVIIGPQNGGFRGKWGVDVKVWFLDPQKAHPCTEPRLLTYFALVSVVASWL